MTNAEARVNNSLRPQKPEGSLGRTAQDGHLDSHTASEIYIYIYKHTHTHDRNAEYRKLIELQSLRVSVLLGEQLLARSEYCSTAHTVAVSCPRSEAGSAGKWTLIGLAQGVRPSVCLLHKSRTFSNTSYDALTNRRLSPTAQ